LIAAVTASENFCSLVSPVDAAPSPAARYCVSDVGGERRDRAPAADRVDADEYPEHGWDPLITFGIVLVILALIFNSAILWIIGGILIVLGAIFWILGALGRAVGGRRHYY
jgi:uncharacterized protein DUF6131